MAVVYATFIIIGILDPEYIVVDTKIVILSGFVQRKFHQISEAAILFFASNKNSSRVHPADFDLRIPRDDGRLNQNLHNDTASRFFNIPLDQLQPNSRKVLHFQRIHNRF